MGLKVGFAALAEKQGRFVRLNMKDGHPHSLALVIRRGKSRFCLLYPDGKTGFLTRNENYQFDLRFVEFAPKSFVPMREQEMALDGTLPKDHIMFDDLYTVSENPMGHLPPPPLHGNDEERFKDPKGPWERMVAFYLKREPPLAFN